MVSWKPQQSAALEFSVEGSCLSPGPEVESCMHIFYCLWSLLGSCCPCALPSEAQLSSPESPLVSPSTVHSSLLSISSSQGAMLRPGESLLLDPSQDLFWFSMPRWQCGPKRVQPPSPPEPKPAYVLGRVTCVGGGASCSLEDCEVPCVFLQTVCTFTDGALVQHQKWDGKESTITRKLKDGKMVVVSMQGLVSCCRLRCSHGLTAILGLLAF